MIKTHDFKNIYEFLKKNSQLNYRKKFFLSLNKNEDMTYFDFLQFIECFGSFLKKNKIQKQKKIIVIFDNSKILTLIFLSIIANYRIFVPINPNSGRKEVEYILKNTEPSCIFIDYNLKNKFNFLPKKIKKIHIKSNNFISFVKKLPRDKIFFGKGDNKIIAQILFTSGSTGDPKGVVLTHKSMLSNLYGIYNSLNIKTAENLKFLATTPLYHNNGQFIPTLLPIIYGASTSTINPETSLLTFWDTCIKLKINYSSVMATHINYFNSLPSIKKHFLKGLFCGGAKLDYAAHKKFEKKYNVKVLCNYGLTETTSIASTEGFSKNANRRGSVGKALHNNVIKIKSSKNNNFGEILIKGENLFYGYLNKKKLTNSKIKNGWLHTGDIGFFDKNGFLNIKDRIDNMIIVSGENIYPSEIENYTSDLPRIKIGVLSYIPDKITQNKLIFIYESDSKIKYNHFYSFYKLRVSKFKIPKLIFRVDELGLKEIPKAPNKKILRSQLKKYLEKFLSNK